MIFGSRRSFISEFFDFYNVECEVYFSIKIKLLLI